MKLTHDHGRAFSFSNDHLSVSEQSVAWYEPGPLCGDLLAVKSKVDLILFRSDAATYTSVVDNTQISYHF